MKREGRKTSVVVRHGDRCSSKQFVFSSVRVRDRTKKRERGKTSVVVCRLSSSVVRVLQAHRLLSLFLSHFSLHLSCLFWHNPPPPRAPVAVKFPTPGTITASSGLFSLPPFQFSFKKKNPISSSFLFAFPPRHPLSVVISNPSCVCFFFLFVCPRFCFLVFKSLFF
jgi:hypothetical protein